MDKFWAGFGAAFRFLRHCDEWIIRSVQETYLWFLDRTGVYVATVAFGVYGVACWIEVTIVHSEPWLWYAFLAMIGAGNIPRYLMQDKGEITAFNSVALVLQQSAWRFWFSFFLLEMGIAEIILGYFWQAMIDLLFCLYMYLLVVMIRDREKKPFFEKKEQLALEGT